MKRTVVLPTRFVRAWQKTAELSDLIVSFAPPRHPLGRNQCAIRNEVKRPSVKLRKNKELARSLCGQRLRRIQEQS
jgi:hypothetical protein